MSAKKLNSVPTDEQTGAASDRRSRRELLPLALILVAAIAFRVVYLLQYRSQIPYFSAPIVDSHLYDTWAQAVTAGKGYGDKPFYMAPLYPYMLALLYKIAGHKLLLVYVIQAVLGVLNLFLVYILGRRVFGQRSGLIAMGMLMLYAPLAFLETKLLTETLAVALNLISILLVMRAVDRPTAGRFLIAGMMLGMSVICRPAALITAVLVGAWLVMPAVRRRNGIRLHSPALVLLGIAITILPITVRNLVVGRDFALISTNAGIVFAQGNNQASKGLFTALPGFSAAVQTEQEESMRFAREALGHPVKPSEVSSYWLRYGLQFIREDPGRYAALLLRKLTWSLHNGESACIYNVYLEKQIVSVLRLLLLPFSVLASFGLFGIVRSMSSNGRRDAQLLLLSVLSVFASLMLFSVSSRYRVPISAPLAVFAGYGISQLIDLVADRKLRGLGISAACIVPVFLVSLVPYPKPYITSEAPANLGVGYFTVGRVEDAAAQLEKAIEMDPGFAYPHLYLGRITARQERYEDAVEHYEFVLDRQPANADAHYYLGYALVQLGRTDEAIRHYEESLRLRPGNVDAHFNLGTLYDVRGETDNAIREYQAAIRLQSDYADAHTNLAIDLYTMGRYAEAWTEVTLSRQHGGRPHPDFIKALSEKTPEPGR